ncbi:hypothetical protein DCAR_0730258 [Daucus carota subsp. sativus]|uniref:Uncharacterized protein n=1 Tax=Daucus carota subsp. sativus TaxID=79200 RepID=A0A164URX1_DAUCS|nr:hypothetical protein DCAR_0730258 [Daucus carota subsp. sativus]
MHLQSRSFNLIDEGVAANNPTQVAITHIFNQIVKGNFENVDIKPMDTTMILGVSLGTGTASASSTDMVDIQVSSLFQALGAEKNYLRIQDDNLTWNTTSVNVATTTNMEAQAAR